MKGLAWESGPISIDRRRDIVQNIYVARSKRSWRTLRVEFATFGQIKDPGKVKKA
jgi:hypothetical protein